MSQLVGHEPCPKCGSRDNLARYDDGHGFCFGCHHYELGEFSSKLKDFMAESQKPVEVNTYGGNNLEMPPPDVIPAISSSGKSVQLDVRALQWLAKYGILSSEYKDFLWSPSKQWLIIPIYAARPLRDHGTKILIAWQARNFNLERPKPKYLTRGPVGDCFCIIGPEYGDTLYLVEDYLSALKVGRSYSAFPLFGSHITLKMLTTLLTRFKNIGVWLDMDKATESLKTARKASQLGYGSCFSIITEKDPKEYTDEEIKEYIKNAA